MTKILNDQRIYPERYKQYTIIDNFGDICAVVVADPNDGRVFKIQFLEETLTGCKWILKYIDDEEKKGGFKS